MYQHVYQCLSIIKKFLISGKVSKYQYECIPKKRIIVEKSISKENIHCFTKKKREYRYKKNFLTNKYIYILNNLIKNVWN
jgi:hypothetical protein